MRSTILLIDHPVGLRDDRASAQLREMGYRLEWCSPGKGDSLPPVDSDYAGVVCFGGAESVNDAGSKPYIRQEIDWIGQWVDSGRPYFGICLGSQLLASALGGRVARHRDGLHEIGYVEIAPTAAANGFLGAPMHVYHWHNEGFEVPDSAELLASGPVFPNQAFRYGDKAYGIQFHPEVGREVMQRWMREAGHMLQEPGAQSSEQQLAGCARHDAEMAAWLRDFLNRWLA
ncbi:MAG: gamma-glutamyl-gamma-aminobutyrate hydrolase family protein [Kiloniellaceae bacterium]